MTHLKPHLFFDGRCLEAINFYLYTLKGEIYNFEKYKDGPIEVNSEDQNKVMIADFNFWGGSFFASDDLTLENKMQANTALTLKVDTEEELQKLFKKLSVKGEIVSNPSPSFFGEISAELIDQFGMRWRVYIELKND